MYIYVQIWFPGIIQVPLNRRPMLLGLEAIAATHNKDLAVG